MTTDHVTSNGTNLHHFALLRGLRTRPLDDGDVAAGVIVSMTREDVRAYRAEYP